MAGGLGGGQGLGFCLRPGSQGLGCEGVRSGREPGKCKSQCSGQIHVGVRRSSRVPFHSRGRRKERLWKEGPWEELLVDQPTAWLYCHSREEGSEQESQHGRHGQFASSLPKEPGGLGCLQGLLPLKWQWSPSLQSDCNGLVLGLTRQAKSKP